MDRKGRGAESTRERELIDSWMIPTRPRDRSLIKKKVAHLNPFPLPTLSRARFRTSVTSSLGKRCLPAVGGYWLGSACPSAHASVLSLTSSHLDGQTNRPAVAAAGNRLLKWHIMNCTSPACLPSVPLFTPRSPIPMPSSRSWRGSYQCCLPVSLSRNPGAWARGGLPPYWPRAGEVPAQAGAILGPTPVAFAGALVPRKLPGQPVRPVCPLSWSGGWRIPSPIPGSWVAPLLQGSRHRCVY